MKSKQVSMDTCVHVTKGKLMQDTCVHVTKGKLMQT